MLAGLFVLSAAVFSALILVSEGLHLAPVQAAVLSLSLDAVVESNEETVLVGVGGFGGFLLLVWTLAASIVLFTRAGRDEVPPPRGPGAAAPAA